MCGIFGIVSKDEINLKSFKKLANLSERRGRDSSGILFFNDETYSVRKADYSINKLINETDISVTVDLDGNGDYQIDTGNGTFDHLIAQLSRHGLMDINLKARGDIHVGWHHLVEDTAIVMGRAFKEAVGDSKMFCDVRTLS